MITNNENIEHDDKNDDKMARTKYNKMRAIIIN